MAGGRGPLEIWNEWATQILVLLSLTLQVVLLLFAGIRRREASALPTLHISLSGAPSKHQLVAFWAPFLLLHLGGPDNITAYSLEDSKLWLRHLQNLVVQVLGAAYVLYKYVAGGDSFVLLAAVLMFGVGVVKYGERTWALMRSNLDSIRDSLEEHVGKHQHFHPPDYESMVVAIEDDEFYLRRAHSMFHVCKRAIVDSWVASVDEEKEDDHQSSWEEMQRADRLCQVPKTLGKDLFTLGKGFAESPSRQRAAGKATSGKGAFAESLLSDTRQSLCRGPRRLSANKSSR